MTRLKKGYGSHKKNIQIMLINEHVVAKIGLGKNKTTTISLCDIDILEEHSFYAHKRQDGKYVARSSTNGAYLHRLLMNPDDEQEIDHVDANPLNNTRPNMRRCTPRQNNLAKKSPLVRGYVGIHRMDGGWYKALDGEGRRVGRYDTASQAAAARDELKMDNYYLSESGEELHNFGFIEWNDESNVPYPKKLSQSDDFLDDETQDAQCHSGYLMLEKGWSCN
ncbi:numod4 motif family protein [Alginatibacterium sediminis]|uniref:Numod4 motif family protein n=1 Tax=Alginatibacterium sediminis TaxID=2164068 RepID=A0A420E7I7_9ALTE|nr:numod4 motif family protein [Alginatibacterium sediminis]RKF14486.1 numod4 motif family protein [Alginatibacterium sediminis]